MSACAFERSKIKCYSQAQSKYFYLVVFLLQLFASTGKQYSGGSDQEILTTKSEEKLFRQEEPSMTVYQETRTYLLEMVI